MNPLKKMKLKTLLGRVRENIERREAGRSPELHEEIKSLIELAEFYAESLYDKDCPHAQMLCREAYRAAALLGNSEAQYRCGKLFMESGHFWMDTVAGLLSCDKQKDYAMESYAEGLKFLQDAESNGHALAKREHGLSYIHGWGVEQDTQKGYELVIKSIDVEGSWDNATEIFQSLGLNSTEFFSMLGALRKQ